MSYSKQTYILILIFFYSFLNAQIENKVDNSYYFDDGGITESKSIIKINTISLLSGDLPIYYERILNNSLSIEIGAGVLLPFYYPEIFADDHSLQKRDYGYSLWIHPKAYYNKKAPEFGYFGLQLRSRKFKIDNYQLNLTDLTINYGIQLVVGERFVIDFNIGYGYRFGINQDYVEDFEFSFPIGIRLGIIL